MLNQWDLEGDGEGESSLSRSGWNIRSMISLVLFIYFSLNKKCYNMLSHTDEIDKTDNG
jgi:hypothetical protein